MNSARQLVPGTKTPRGLPRFNDRSVIGVIALAASLGAGVVLLWPHPLPRATGSLPQSAYVWQRVWHPPVQTSILEHATNFHALVVLGAEVTWQAGRPGIYRVPLQHETLRQAGRPVGLALRIGPHPGPFSPDDDHARGLAALAASLVRDALTNGLAPAELQIDFDCAERKLDGYRLWVEAIRREVQPVPLVITALPAWLGQRTFRQLVAAADGFVLQVHSLERPRSHTASFALCDPAAARRAVEQAARMGRPFRVALPTYGYVTAFTADGRFVGLSAEGPAPHWPANLQRREVWADPAALAALVREWHQDRPAALRGILWYRLPVASDRLNWTWSTLSCVMNGVSPTPQLQVDARRPQPELVQIELANLGSARFAGRPVVRAKWPEGRLVAADGLAGFEPDEADARVLEFRPGRQQIVLQPGEKLAIGWLRLERNVPLECELVSDATPQ